MTAQRGKSGRRNMQSRICVLLSEACQIICSGEGKIRCLLDILIDFILTNMYLGN